MCAMYMYMYMYTYSVYIAHACTRVYVHRSIPGRKENRTCPEEVILTLRPSQTHALHVHVYMYMYMYMEKYPFYSVLAKEESKERKREGMYMYMGMYSIYSSACCTWWWTSLGPKRPLAVHGWTGWRARSCLSS